MFAAGNFGPNRFSISPPAAAKNVIAVGASENLRDLSDSCGGGPSESDDPNEIASFSSRGPASGSRLKPELVAPGSHIQGIASIAPDYIAFGLCDAYNPKGQNVFTAGSGTSHSTPAITGLASLSYWWISQGGAGPAAGTVDVIGGARAPSPAAMKASLMAHTTFLTGNGAGANLPSETQGYGMPTLSLMFDATPKTILDQSILLDGTGQTETLNFGIADPDKPVRIALAYTDAPGQPGFNPQVNNLDLMVKAGGSTYLGNVMTGAFSVTGGSADARNNYEAVYLPAGVSGSVEVTVQATNIAGDGVPNTGDATDQDFAIVCSNCARAASFTLIDADREAAICAGGQYTSEVSVGAVLGFNNPVALGLGAAPAGASASVTPATVNPGQNAMIQVNSTAATPAGRYEMTLTGTSGSLVRTLDYLLDIASTPPPPPALAAPSDAATGVSLAPLLSWAAAARASRYFVEIATDAAFQQPVDSATVTTTAWMPAGLQAATRYFWRVSAINSCGTSATGSDRIFGNGFDGGSQPPPSTGEIRSFTTI